MLRQTIQRADTRLRAVKRALRHRFLRCPAFQHLEPIARRKQRLRRLEEYADERATRDAAATLRRGIRA